MKLQLKQAKGFILMTLPPLLYQVACFLIPKLIKLITENGKPDSCRDEWISFAVLILILVILIILYYRLFTNGNRTDNHLLFRYLIIGAAFAAVMGLLGMKADKPGTIPGIISACMLGPICEELVFRGFSYEYGSRFFYTRTVVIITSLLFSAAHPATMVTIAISFAVGILLGMTRAKCNTVVYPSLIHITMNSIMFLMI